MTHRAIRHADVIDAGAFQFSEATRLLTHHLHVQAPSDVTAGRWRESIGQCSPGSLALAITGQPHPSVASRSIWERTGFPQYDTPARSTRSGHISQVAARVGHCRCTGSAPSLRNWPAAILAMALDRSAHRLLLPQV